MTQEGHKNIVGQVQVKKGLTIKNDELKLTKRQQTTIMRYSAVDDPLERSVLESKTLKAMKVLHKSPENS